ncbi:4-hydroxy-3-methylbut-2-enyl diphosphate reductase [Catenibacillus scindens]|uniref:4-hydroxy-3-methylbut-2-enyl diphosphate reductase n=1 Tax=Catenibacillus scindens TaxID=673271 RepID=UPI00320883D0
MKVTLAKTAGFCFGVKRAVHMVYDEIGDLPVFTYGPIIHNEAVVEDLKERGVQVVESIDDERLVPGAAVVIRSHGISRNVYEALEKKGVRIVDATCPFVKKIHRIVEAQSEEGRHIIIIGNNRHPEVEAIKGWCKTPATVIETIDEADSFHAPASEKLCIVSQTTFNYNKFQELVEIISKKGYDIRCLNTICNATEERQSEARQIAANVDAMIVIGGRHSSNTQKLFEICKNECENTYYIQTLNDLDLAQVKSMSNVGITAGASTPNNIIEEVHKACLK